MNHEQLEFPVEIYGSLITVNETISKARCRIFYKYGNRNGTYITDEFAQELISTVAYVPVKGIYEGDDFTDHGTARAEGRIYGIVPENPNFAWEKHEDVDGVEREYACVDVYLFTAIYPEASQIMGKSQSMELYAPSLKYHEAVIKGAKYIVFDHGCFLGLQVLGEEVEPCFEGAAFYTLQQSIEDSIQKIREISTAYELNGGHPAMDFEQVIYRLSDREKFDALWILLNPNCDAEHDWECNYGIIDVYDQFVIALNYNDGNFERIFYHKDDEKDMVEILSKEVVYQEWLNESEHGVVETLRALNGGTYEKVSETLENAEANFTELQNLQTKFAKSENTISTLQQEKETYTKDLADATAHVDTLTGTINSLNDQVASLNEELNSLNEYKHNIESQQKSAVINEYVNKLSEDILDVYRAKIDEYTVTDLDMALAYELKKSNPSIFESKDFTGFVLKPEQKTGVEAILSKYKK